MLSSELVTAAATVLIAITGVVALVYAAMQLKQGHDDEKIKHLLEFNKEFDSEPMTIYRRTVAARRLEGIRYPPEAYRLLDFFETIGRLEQRGYLDDVDIWAMFSYWMFNIYEDFRGAIEEVQDDDRNYYKNSCALLEKLYKIDKKHGSASFRPSADEIKSFWEDEAQSLSWSTITTVKQEEPAGKTEEAESE